MTHSRPTRIALFNPIIAHYRAGLLRELQSNEHCEFFWFADSRDPVHGIPAIDLSADSHFTPAPVSTLARLKWQHGTLRAALADYDTFVFLGSADWISSWIGALVARLRGKRVLFWTHGWMRRDRFAKRLVRNSMYRLAHGLLLYGERARRIGIAHGFDPQRLHVMYNSLDFDTQQHLRSTVTRDDSKELRTRLFGEAEVAVAIATARLTATKQFHLLIRAAGLLARKGRRLNLLIVGDGPERAALERLAASENVKTAFVGACYDEAQLARYFLCANVTVSPGNVGLTCMHSLGYGVPVITHDEPADQMPEWEAIVPGVNGTLFIRNCVESLAQKIDVWTRAAWLADTTRDVCLTSLRTRYHPKVQHRVIENAITGKPALVLQSETCSVAL